MKERTITIFTENKPGVLFRIADLFLRRKINIEKLDVAETAEHGISRFEIVIRSDDKVAAQTIKQIKRIVEVTDAY